MIVKLGDGEWFECQADVTVRDFSRYGITIGLVQLTVTDRNGGSVVALKCSSAEVAQLEQRLAEARKEVEEP